MHPPQPAHPEADGGASKVRDPKPR
jgi:hypothetical protein